jgi:hypothetical protein
LPIQGVHRSRRIARLWVSFPDWCRRPGVADCAGFALAKGLTAAGVGIASMATIGLYWNWLGGISSRHFSSICATKWENCAMPKRSSIGRRRSKALPALGLSLSMASGACASASEASANPAPSSLKHEVFLAEEEISDVSLATFHVFDKENAGPPPLSRKPRLAAGCGAGCGCGTACAYWPQPPQPPQATQPTQHRKKKPSHRRNGVRYSPSR